MLFNHCLWKMGAPFVFLLLIPRRLLFFVFLIFPSTAHKVQRGPVDSNLLCFKGNNRN